MLHTFFWALIASLLLFSLDWPGDQFSLEVVTSICLSVCICDIPKHPLWGVEETFGHRTYFIY